MNNLRALDLWDLGIEAVRSSSIQLRARSTSCAINTVKNIPTKERRNSLTRQNIFVGQMFITSHQTQNFFFCDKEMKGQSVQCSETKAECHSYLGSPSNKSARSGLSPSVRHQVVFRAGSTRDAAKETAEHTASILVQCRFHMSASGNCMGDGASRALACANCCMVCKASLHHLNLSTSTTSR